VEKCWFGGLIWRTGKVSTNPSSPALARGSGVDAVIAVKIDIAEAGPATLRR